MNQPKEIHLQRKALISDRLPTLLANDPELGHLQGVLVF